MTGDLFMSNFVTDECRCAVCVPKCDPMGCSNVKCLATGVCVDELPVVAAPSIVPAQSSRLVVAFTGLAGSGKSTAATHLVNWRGFTRTRFAGPLKAMMAALGLTQAEIDGDRKELPCALLGGRTPRYAMQTIGTEWGRDIIDSDLWIRAWLNSLPPNEHIVVDDCRFPNEVDAVRSVGGLIVQIDRPGAGSGAAGHSSEGQPLPQDWTIRNDRDVSFMLDQVDVFLRDMTWAKAGTA